MIKSKGLKGCVLFAALFLFSGTVLSALDLYLLPKVMGTNDEPLLGSFVVQLGESHGRTAGNESWSLEPLDLNISNPAIIPARTIKELLIPAVRDNFVLVGNYSLYVPTKIRERNKESVAAWFELLEKSAGGLTSDDAWIEFSLIEDGAVEEGNVRIERYIQVFKTAGGMRIGEKVTRADLLQVYTPADPKKEYMSARMMLEEYQAAVLLSPGKILETGDLEKADLVQAGERIAIIIDRQPIRMELEGISYGSGGKGDFVRVKPVRSEKSLYGKIVSRGKVRIDEL